MKPKLLLAGFIVAGLTLSAQTQTAPKTTPAAKPAAKTAAPAAKKTPVAKPTTPPPPPEPDREPGLYAIFDIWQGGQPFAKIVTKLYEKESPITVKNFTDLAQGRKSFVDPKTGATVRRPLYNGLTFHRVIPGFMIQGGDPLGIGTGGTAVIKDEFGTGLKFDGPGYLAMANAGPNTGSCQFFITEVPTPHLTDRHTIFGKVVEGQENVEKIARVPRGAKGPDMPNTPVIMKTVTIKRYGPAPEVPKPAAPVKKTAPVKKAAPAKP